MNPALQKTLGLLLIIGIGLLLQRKIASKDQLKGIKVLILSVALPATIFVALLKIELESSLLILPLIALLFNFVLLLATQFSLGVFGVEKHSSTQRTLLMLLPSLAPGLSCFPFIAEYLSGDELAMAALADVGNKVFVLIFLYMLAMHWYHKQAINNQSTGKTKLKGLLISMLNEPINMVIIVALVMLSFGFGLNSFPVFVENTILRITTIMTPLILLFIGMAVKIKWKELHLIFFLLTWRAGLAFCLSAMVIFLAPALTPAIALLIVVFPQSACSFWPFAHMSAVDGLEKQDKSVNQTFNTDFALSVLACSLPFSTILILGIFSFSNYFIEPIYLLLAGATLICTAFLPIILSPITKLSTQEPSRQLNFFTHAVEDIESRQAS